MVQLGGLPEIREGDDLAGRLAEALCTCGEEITSSDILVLAHKVLSKAEGRLVDLATIEPTARARELAQQVNKDPRKVEVILRESSEVLRAHHHPDHKQGVLICRHRLGFVSANAAVDESNVPGEDRVALLPEDPDASARKLRDDLEDVLGVRIGIIITDTFGRPWRRGLVNIAVGLAGVPARLECTGQRDPHGYELRVSSPAFADEVAAASGLLMEKTGQTPAVLVKGLAWEESKASARDLVRPPEEDLFL